MQRASCSVLLLFVEAAGAVAIGAVGGVSAAVETVLEARLVGALLSLARIEVTGCPALGLTVVEGRPVAWLIAALLAGIEAGAHVADEPPDLIVTSAHLGGEVLEVASESVGIDGVLNVVVLLVVESVGPRLLDLAVELPVDRVPVDLVPVGVLITLELGDVGHVTDADPAPSELVGEGLDVRLEVASGRLGAVKPLVLLRRLLLVGRLFALLFVLLLVLLIVLVSLLLVVLRFSRVAEHIASSFVTILVALVPLLVLGVVGLVWVSILKVGATKGCGLESACGAEESDESELLHCVVF